MLFLGIPLIPVLWLAASCHGPAAPSQASAMDSYSPHSPSGTYLPSLIWIFHLVAVYTASCKTFNCLSLKHDFNWIPLSPMDPGLWLVHLPHTFCSTDCFHRTCLEYLDSVFLYNVPVGGRDKHAALSCIVVIHTIFPICFFTHWNNSLDQVSSSKTPKSFALKCMILGRQRHYAFKPQK